MTQPSTSPATHPTGGVPRTRQLSRSKSHRRSTYTPPAGALPQLVFGLEWTDRRAAAIFAARAGEAGLRRIVYLGGLLPAGVDERDLSPHLRSRSEVGRILSSRGVPSVVLRAAVIIGSGSASFEMLRHLTERLPVMVTPRWVRTRLQPIAVRDVLRYLVGCAALPDEVDRAFDIGGPDVLSYRDMMQRYAWAARLPRRLLVPVPVLSPGLSSLCVGLVTPVPPSIARPLTESLRHEVVCREDDITRYIPDPPDGRIGFERAAGLALQRIQEAGVTTRWSSASVPGAPSDPLPTDPGWAGGTLYTDSTRRSSAAWPATSPRRPVTSSLVALRHRLPPLPIYDAAG